MGGRLCLPLARDQLIVVFIEVAPSDNSLFGDSTRRLEQRRNAIVSKLDRGYEDYVTGKISDEFWTRKSQEWEAELQTVDVERKRGKQPPVAVMATAAKITELAKQAEFVYNTQDPAEQRRLLETVLSNCTFDRGSLSPTYSKPFDLFVRGNETGEWRGRRDSCPSAARAADRLRTSSPARTERSQRGGPLNGTRASQPRERLTA